MNRRVRARKFENKAYVRWSATEMMRFVRRAGGELAKALREAIAIVFEKIEEGFEFGSFGVRLYY